MIVTLERRPTQCAVRCASSHPAAHLVGAQHGAHLVVEDLRRGARKGLQAGIHQAQQVVDRSGSPSRLAPSVTSSAVKPWMWMPGAASATARVTST